MPVTQSWRKDTKDRPPCTHRPKTKSWTSALGAPQRTPVGPVLFVGLQPSSRPHPGKGLGIIEVTLRSQGELLFSPAAVSAQAFTTKYH